MPNKRTLFASITRAPRATPLQFIAKSQQNCAGDFGNLETGAAPDRGRESASSPSLRTGQALFTHPALQLMGSNSETEVFEF